MLPFNTNRRIISKFSDISRGNKRRGFSKRGIGIAWCSVICSKMTRVLSGVNSVLVGEAWNMGSLQLKASGYSGV